MSFAYSVKDISLIEFICLTPNANEKYITDQIIPFKLERLGNGKFRLIFRPECIVTQNNHVVLKMIIEATFLIQEHDTSRNTLSVDACLKVIKCGLDYLQGILAVESKRKLNVPVLISQPDENRLRQLIQQEIIRMN